MSSEQGLEVQYKQIFGSVMPYEVLGKVGLYPVSLAYLSQIPFSVLHLSVLQDINAARQGAHEAHCPGWDVQILEKLYPGRPIVNDLYEVCNRSLAALRRQRAQS